MVEKTYTEFCEDSIKAYLTSCSTSIEASPKIFKESMEKIFLAEMMYLFNCNQSKVALLLGLSRGKLINDLKKYWGDRYVKSKK